MEDETEIESEYFQDPEVDREWLEGDLAELQHEGRVQQQVTAAQINQMLLIQAKTGYGSVFDLISDHFPSLVYEMIAVRMPGVSTAETTVLTLATRKALENGMHRKRIAGEFQKVVENFSRL